MIVQRDTFIAELRKALTKELARLPFHLYPLNGDEILVQTTFLGQSITRRVDFSLPGISEKTADELISQARVSFLAEVYHLAEVWDMGTHEWPPLTYGDALTAMTFGVSMRRKDWPLGKRIYPIPGSHIEVETLTYIPSASEGDFKQEPFTPTYVDLMATDWMRA